MKDSRLAILGTGTWLPPTVPATMLVEAAGTDPRGYLLWPKVSWAGPEDHPGSMGAKALAAALERSGVIASELSLVISGGMSRDYPPSWSVAAEVMKACGASNECLGVDLTGGCLGSLVALDYAQGWLAQRGGGIAAIVCSERWAWTVDRSTRDWMLMWGYGDGAAAIIVGVGSAKKALANYAGAAFHSESSLNGQVLIRYGGTRHPSAPPGVEPSARWIDLSRKDEVREIYVHAYASAFARLRRRFDVAPSRLVCNQISIPMIETFAGLAGVPIERTVNTGNEAGHVGSVDLPLGIDRLLSATGVDGPVYLAGSTPYLFGAGLLLPAP